MPPSEQRKWQSVWGIPSRNGIIEMGFNPFFLGANSIHSELEYLSPAQQNQVLHFVRQLKSAQDKEQRRKAILASAGSIPHDEIERMREAIKEGCEQINPHGW